jgi:hypothetical protein
MTDAARAEPAKRASTTFKFSMGLKYRGSYVFELRNLAMACNVVIEINENRGWITSDYCARVSGLRSDVEIFCTSMDDWSRRLKEAGLA